METSPAIFGAVEEQGDVLHRAFVCRRPVNGRHGHIVHAEVDAELCAMVHEVVHDKRSHHRFRDMSSPRVLGRFGAPARHTGVTPPA